MTAIALLDILSARGVSIRVEGQDLKLKPTGALDDDLLHQLRSLKSQLMELLANEPTGPAVQALREATQNHQWPGIPGLVRMSVELIELWRTAEVEFEHPLTVNGKPRGQN